jgi:hypothetical protein
MPSRPPEQQADPAPQAGDPSVKIKRFKGLVNTLDLERLSSDDLWRAVNIDIDDDGEIHRRRGYTQVTTEPTHSLFTSENGTVYGVVNGILSIIHPDYSTIPLLDDVGDAYWDGGLGLDYYQVGANIYFSGTSVSGIIETTTQTVVPWGPADDFWLSPVVNPTATLPAIRGRLMGPPPRASFLAAFNGRMYLGQGRTVWCTEPFLYGLVDQTKNFFQFEGDITMLGTVGDGIFAGTTEGLWFLQGPSFPLKRTRIMDSGVLPRSMTYVPGELANPPQVGMESDTPLVVSIMFQTPRGICVAMDGGKALNLTESKFFFPQAQRSAAMFRRQDGMNQYVAVNDSRGQPVNGARIGDYVDAFIIRANAIWVTMDEGIVVRDVVGASA